MTQTLSVLLVDDEPLAIRLMEKRLNEYKNIKVIGSCNNGEQAIQFINQNQPDLVFMDIQMPGLSGLDTVKKIQAELMPAVVFATAFEEFAINAFDLNAVDYILKPIDAAHIERALTRAAERLSARQEHNNKSHLIHAVKLIDKYNAANNKEKIVIKDNDEITLVEQNEIAWIDAAGDYCCIHANGKTHIKRTTLSKLLKELDQSTFKRIHRSTIVNLNFIKGAKPLPKGEYLLDLGHNEQVKVSRSNKDQIKAFFEAGG
ncbi:LytR/AlgR family response regulator transcription factor [Gayadomonas joobiniege]|uniref:LytR/AlgR family response regulator transcription factor n=1 Tax=Gayadomonas joobiniege TaxID=1234606 RepID=UPI0003748199|nr:LytTR family DNA-binding domain-containing protein [Gayadomonas joobiniege]